MANKENKIEFESALAELEKIVEKLEDENLSLEDSIKSFETGVKLVKDITELKEKAKVMLGMNLITHQTGPEGKEVKRLYVEESSNIKKEFYLSCLVDRASSKIAFISSDQGGMDIEEVARSNPEKIITTKVDLLDEIKEEDCKKILKVFGLDENASLKGIQLIKSIYKMFYQLQTYLDIYVHITFPDQTRPDPKAYFV